MKGIDKKACRAFLNPQRALDLNSGLFYVEQIEYIVCTAIHIVGHRKLLILDFYPRTEAVKGMLSPHFTMFQATDDFLTFDHILSVLAHHPEFVPPKQSDTTVEVRDTPQIGQEEEFSSVQNGFMTEEGLSAINKTLSAFRSQ